MFVIGVSSFIKDSDSFELSIDLVLLLGFSLMFYVSKQKRYLKIIDDCEKLPKSKRKVLGYISVLYVVAVFVCFFWLGELIRDYNMH